MTGSAHDAAAFAHTLPLAIRIGFSKGTSLRGLIPHTHWLLAPSPFIGACKLDPSQCNFRCCSISSSCTVWTLHGCIKGQMAVSSRTACAYQQQAATRQGMSMDLGGIILHNIVIDVEGEEWARHYIQQHNMAEEQDVVRMLVTMLICWMPFLWVTGRHDGVAHWWDCRISSHDNLWYELTIILIAIWVQCQYEDYNVEAALHALKEIN